MGDDEAGEWVPLAEAVGRAEDVHGRWLSEQIMSGRYPVSWLDEQGVRRFGRFPEHVWRSGRIAWHWSFASFRGREYQRIAVWLPREELAAKAEAPSAEPEPAAALDPTRTGAPGRRGTSYLVVQEAERRLAEGARPHSLEAFAKELLAWYCELCKRSPELHPLALGTVMNAVRALFNAQKT
jgi:hypothetical protein